MKNKKGEVLIETVIFVVLNLIYLTILILFIARAGSGVLNIEESYAKQLALIIDSSEPGTEIFLNMEDAIKITKEKWGEEHVEKDIITITSEPAGIVTIKLSENSGYSYSFFNDVVVTDEDLDKDLGGFVFKINKK